MKLQASRFLPLIAVGLALFLFAPREASAQSRDEVTPLSTSDAGAPVLTTVYSFSGMNGSSAPGPSALTQGRDAKLSGTTTGSPSVGGAAFTVTTSGRYVQSYTFETDGNTPWAGLTLGSDGNYYGAASAGGTTGNGVLFMLSPTGNYTALHEFAGGSDGAAPFSPPIQASDLNFYGTTTGTNGTSTIYRYQPNGAYSTIYSFGSAQGQRVIAPLIQGSDGNLYGTASAGGNGGCGALFKISTGGQLLWSYDFPCGPGGEGSVAPLLQATDGNFYGVSFAGGLGVGCGTVFKLDQNGDVSLLYAFKNAPDGCEPEGGLTQGTDGNLYGTTASGGKGPEGGGGTLFQLTLQGVHSIVEYFGIKGSEPLGTLMQHTNGKFYGTTLQGGRSSTAPIYSLDMGLGPFVTFVRPTGRAGQTAQILGQDLTGATSVTFNGILSDKLQRAQRHVYDRCRPRRRNDRASRRDDCDGHAHQQRQL